MKARMSIFELDGKIIIRGSQWSEKQKNWLQIQYPLDEAEAGNVQQLMRIMQIGLDRACDKEKLPAVAGLGSGNAEGRAIR